MRPLKVLRVSTLPILPSLSSILHMRNREKYTDGGKFSQILCLAFHFQQCRGDQQQDECKLLAKQQVNLFLRNAESQSKIKSIDKRLLTSQISRKIPFLSSELTFKIRYTKILSKQTVPSIWKKICLISVSRE
jgi:hypothetical protein